MLSILTLIHYKMNFEWKYDDSVIFFQAWIFESCNKDVYFHPTHFRGTNYTKADFLSSTLMIQFLTSWTSNSFKRFMHRTSWFFSFFKYGSQNPTNPHHTFPIFGRQFSDFVPNLLVNYSLVWKWVQGVWNKTNLTPTLWL